MKLKGESYEHVETFFDVLESIEAKNSGIIGDPSDIWNMDGTVVDVTWGKVTKSYGSDKSKHGGCKVARKVQGVDKHITAMFLYGASVLKSPRFLIVAGKNIMNV